MRGRRVILIHSLVAAVLLTALAGQRGTPSARAGSGTRTAPKITLTLWYWNRSIDDAVIAQVDKQFPTISLQAEKIGGNYNAKLRTTLAGQTDVPDIVGLNSDVSTFFPDESQFVNLLDEGAGAVKSQYLGWKWQQGIAPDGKMIAFPMDTGPTALFYRADLFKKAGLPTDPRQVAALMSTWNAYFQAGKKLQAALPKAHMLDSLYFTVFNQVMAQSATQYENKAGRFIGDQAPVQRAWNLAVAAHDMGLSAKSAAFTTDWNAAISDGAIASFVGAVWMKAILQDAALTTAGAWRVARAPGGAGNQGGSFLAVTKYSQHPKEAFAVVKWLESPRNQLRAYVDLALFPSTPSAYSSPAMNHAEPFYGGQNTTPVFALSAKNVKPAYYGADYDIINAIFEQDIINIDTLNEGSQQAWHDTQHEVQRELSH